MGKAKVARAEAAAEGERQSQISPMCQKRSLWQKQRRHPMQIAATLSWKVCLATLSDDGSAAEESAHGDEDEDELLVRALGIDMGPHPPAPS